MKAMATGFDQWTEALDKYLASTGLPTRSKHFRPETLRAGFDDGLMPEEFLRRLPQLDAPKTSAEPALPPTLEQTLAAAIRAGWEVAFISEYGIRLRRSRTVRFRTAIIGYVGGISVPVALLISLFVWLASQRSESYGAVAVSGFAGWLLIFGICSCLIAALDQYLFGPPTSAFIDRAQPMPPAVEGTWHG